MELMEKTVESRVLFEGKIITVRLDKAELPNGRVASREVVEHPGGVAILPLFDDGTVSLVRQFRYPFQEVVAELPAGKLERGRSRPLRGCRSSAAVRPHAPIWKPGWPSTAAPCGIRTPSPRCSPTFPSDLLTSVV